MIDIAANSLEHGEMFPYNGRAPADKYERAAIGVLADLCDRRGVKQELSEVDDEIKEEIVTSLAAIIRLAVDTEGVKP